MRLIWCSDLESKLTVKIVTTSSPSDSEYKTWKRTNKKARQNVSLYDFADRSRKNTEYVEHEKKYKYKYIYNIYIYWNKRVEREGLFQNLFPSQINRPQTLEIFERMMLQNKQEKKRKNCQAKLNWHWYEIQFLCSKLHVRYRSSGNFRQ